MGDVTIDGEPVTSGRVRTLLVRLAVSPGSIVSDDALIEAIWPGGPPKSARTALQTHVGNLRDLLEPDRARRTDGSYLFRRHGGYLLDAGVDVDIARLRDDVDRAEAARNDQPRLAMTHLDEALALWRPEPLAAFTDQEWAVRAAATLEDYATRATAVWAEIAIDSGRPDQAVARLETAVAAFPYHEHLAALLMLALAGAGRQADALAVYQAAHRRLGEDLGVEPGPGLRSAERVVLGTGDDDGRPAPSRKIRDEDTRFFGRLRLQDDLRRTLADHRLVTLVGPGGVGKSRVARRTVAGLARDWAVDVVRLDLADVAEGQVAASVLEHFGAAEHPRVAPGDALRTAIGQRDTILVLDTCEHRRGEVRALADDLLDSPTLRILATSRMPLDHRSERVIDVDPLDLDESVRLMLDRAGLEQIDTADRVALGEVCRRLDGLPLAVELAAGRLRTLRPQQLMNVVRRGRAELRGGDDRPRRHRDLAETIAWSYNLLDEPLQQALREISAFHGSFDEVMLETLTTSPTSAAALPALVERSLVSRDATVTGRYRLLDTVREFVATESERLGESADRWARHADWIFRMALGNVGGADVPSFNDLRAEIIPALDHAASDGSTTELALLTLLGGWWVEASMIAEGRRRIEEALARHTDAADGERTPVEAVLGFLAWYEGDGRTAAAVLTDVAPRVRAIGFAPVTAMVDTCLAFVEGRFVDAERSANELLAASSGRDDFRMLALFMAGNVALYGGDDRLAADRYGELRIIAERADRPFQIGQSLRFEALATTGLGLVDEGWALAERALVVAEADGSLPGISQARAILALVSLRAGDADVAWHHAVEAAKLSPASFDSFSLRTALPVAASIAGERGKEDLAAVITGWVQHLVNDSRLWLVPLANAYLEAAVNRLGASSNQRAGRRRAAQAAALELDDIIARLDASPLSGAP